MIRDFIEFFSFTVGLFLALCVVVALPLIALDMWQCRSYQETTGKPTKYRAGMCFIKDGGEWYSWTEYKHRLVTKGEMK